LWWSRDERIASFAKADRIHLLLPHFLRSLPPALRERAVLIPNGVEIDPALHPVSDVTSKRIVCVARFAPQKRLDLLVEAFAIVAEARPDWELLILGDGQLKPQITQQVESLGLSPRVSMPGTADNVDEMLAGSSIFVLPSAFEGFSIVLLEAQRAGLPCVAFKACNGPNRLIHSGVDGLLVEPFEAPPLAEALLTLIDDEEMRRRIGRAARDSVTRYALEKVMARWVGVIDEMVAELR
jgi:glycosyltransferase involved in cell wall biosynthesis